jgi:hypothetical protein
MEETRWESLRYGQACRGVDEVHGVARLVRGYVADYQGVNARQEGVVVGGRVEPRLVKRLIDELFVAGELAG